VARIEVVPDDLTNLAAKLSDIHQHMTGGIGGVDGGAANQSVVDAVNHFSDKWDYSMGKIADAAGTAGENLKNAAQGYQNADNSLSQSSGG
jgi:uncharacterized protein YukE